MDGLGLSIQIEHSGRIYEETEIILPKQFGVLMMTVLLTACSNVQSDLPEQQGQLPQGEGEILQELRIPENAVGCCVYLRVVMPKRALVRDKGGPGYGFRSINYKTGELVASSMTNSNDEIWFYVNSRPFDYDNEFFSQWEKFPQTDQVRFGLEYRPLDVPGRPEELWRRAYFKQGVSGEDFYISCTPPIGPNSISPPTACAMHMQIEATKIEDRLWGAYIRVGFSESRLSDWQAIERAALNHFDGRLEIVN
jgi:hypothetical protein